MALHQSLKFLDLNYVQLIIANSLRGKPALINSDFPRHTELLLYESSYWASSVSSIYREFLQNSYRCPLLLMNHDCIPDPDCIFNLLEESKKHSLYAIHAQLNYLHDPNQIWWAGSRISCMGTRFLANSAITQSDSSLLMSSSTMGQCLIIHPDLVDPSFLCESFLPHYFADSVQTTLMRRRGAVVAVLRTAIAYTDQSDYRKKINRWYSGPKHLFVFRILFSPWSNRLLTARAFAAFTEIDNKFHALLFSFLISCATIFVTLRDYLRLLFKDFV